MVCVLELLALSIFNVLSLVSLKTGSGVGWRLSVMTTAGLLV